VLYEVGERRIEVLAVIHGRRLLESVSERFD
jgi:plasmid stabilization system protein ParE